MRAADLSAFYSQVGIVRPGPTINESETPRLYALSLRLSAEHRQRFNAAAIAALEPSLGAALTLRVGESVAPLLELRPGAWPADLAAAAERVRAAPSDVRLELSIDKRPLIAQLPGLSPECSVLYYLFRERFRVFLDGRLDALDTELFPDATRPTLVIISDCAAYYDGPLLVIVGEDRYATLTPPVCPPIAVGTAARLTEFRRTVHEQVGVLSWSGLSLQSLTPLHLRVDARGPIDSVFDQTLVKKLWHLGLLYTANQSVYAADGGLAAYFSSAERTARVDVTPTDNPAGDRLRVGWFGTWPYEGERDSTDRLAILRNVCARELDSANGADNARKLGTRLEYIQGQAQWHLEVYVDNKIDAQFAQLNAATEYATEAARKIGDSVDGLAKGMTDAGLATVAAVFAAAVTPLLKNDFPAPIIGALLLVYALYLEVFQVRYRLESIHASAAILRGETTARLDRFEVELGPTRVGPLKLQVAQRWTFFDQWFGRTKCWTRYLLAGLIVIAVLWPFALSGSGWVGTLVSPKPATTVGPSPVVSPALPSPQP